MRNRTISPAKVVQAAAKNGVDTCAVINHMNKQNIDLDDPLYKDYIKFCEIKSSFQLKMPTYKEWCQLQRESTLGWSRGFEILE